MLRLPVVESNRSPEPLPATPDRSSTLPISPPYKSFRTWPETSREDPDLTVCNSQAEKGVDHKSKPCYLGPFEVVCHTQGGSYILKEMDGTTSAQGIAVFQLIPYYSQHTPLPASILPDDNESDDEWNAYDSDDLSWWKDDGKDNKRCWKKMLKELLMMLMTYDEEDANEKQWKWIWHQWLILISMPLCPMLPWSLCYLYAQSIPFPHLFSSFDRLAPSCLQLGTIAFSVACGCHTPNTFGIGNMEHTVDLRLS